MQTEIVLTGVKDALSILGEKNVVSCTQAADVWKQDCAPSDLTVVYYSPERLAKCADENESKSAEWYLLFISQITTADIWKLRAEIHGARPHLGPLELFREFQGDPWLDILPSSGYQLIDMKSRFESDDWDDQEQRIHALGEGFQRAEDAPVIQGLILLAEVLRKDRYLATKHWGPTRPYAHKRLAMMPEVNERIHFEYTDDFLEFDKLPVLVSLRPGTLQ